MEEKESIPMKVVSVGWYGHTDHADFESTVSAIQAFLVKNGGSCIVIRKKVSKKDANMLIEFTATIPVWFASRHHGFDSRLNSTTDGFGCAWVEHK